MVKSFVALLVFIISLLASLTPVKASALSSTVLINEVKIGGAVSGQLTQFVELINISENEVDLAGWTLEHAKEGYNSTLCSGVWESNDTGDDNTPTVLSGTLPGATDDTYSTVLLEISLTDHKSGSLQLLDTTNDKMDMVGWGETAPCHEGNRAPLPNNSKSIERLLDCDATVTDTDDNDEDFTITITPTPSSIGQVFLPSCALPEPTPSSYQNIRINELFPNPASPLLDEEAEFIELYNPNSTTVNLQGYTLYSGSSFQYKYILPGYDIAPFSYIVLYSGETKLTLSNTGSTAKITDPAGGNTHTTESYDDVGENEAWAYDDGEWRLTEQPTPGQENTIVTTSTSTTGGKGSELEPCPPGKFRNPATNRCKNIESASGLTPCKPGQARNPETNRCRSIAVGATSLVPCKPGQERNPATNRCRSVAGASSSLVPCKAGYERNAETNRCRKVSGSTGTLSNTAVATQTGVSYPAILVVSILALGYGIYEYRQELTEFLRKFAKLVTKK